MIDALDVLKEKASSLNVVVIGDVGIDTTFYGTQDRRANEFAGNVFDVDQDSRPAYDGGLTEFMSLSMAARLAHQVAMIGCKTTLVGRVGEDHARMNFEELCAIAKIDFIPIGGGPSIPTSNKVRFKVQDSIVFRADFELPVTVQHPESEVKEIAALCRDADVVLVSDYAKGVVTELVMRAARTGKRLYIDPKPRDDGALNDGLYGIQADGMKLNRPESIKILNSHSNNFQVLAIDVMNRYDVKDSVLISGGPEESYLAVQSGLDRKRVMQHQPLAEVVRDVTGAGDVLMAYYSLLSALGVGMGDMMYLSQKAAAIAVETGALVTLEALENDQG